jgi:Cft2 family RNA processing exonuclease
MHASMLKAVEQNGLYLPNCGLWMDAQRAKPFAVVSHAHSDHTARHQSFLATAPTIDCMRVRMGDAVANRGIALKYGEVYQHGTVCIQLFPAGHVLGSAMVRVEAPSGESMLYTGDFKTRPGLAAEAIEIPQADTLIMESTFGRPEFVFPPTEVVQQQIHDFCADALTAGEVPVLLAYSLGKAQEVLKLLQPGDFSLMAHQTIRALNPVYDKYAIVLPATRPLDFLNMEGCVVVMPPAVRRHLPKGQHRLAMISGWGLQPNSQYRYRTDAVLPLSDHADYAELLEFVDAVGPRKVFTMHGSTAALAASLRRRGVDAWSLSGSDQLELF